MTEDPAGTDVRGFSHYAYAHDAPVRLVDPFGLKPGDLFKRDPNAAVLDVFGWMRDWGSALTVEWGGKVCKDKKECYFCTSPITDNDPIGAPSRLSPCPAGTEEVGYYHNHPSGNPTSVGDMSIVSARAATQPEYAGYTWRSGGNEWGVLKWTSHDPVWNPDGSPNFGERIGIVKPSGK
jgi:hypothetical protein